LARGSDILRIDRLEVQFRDPLAQQAPFSVEITHCAADENPQSRHWVRSLPEKAQYYDSFRAERSSDFCSPVVV
jgi:hypothetical protein